MGTAYKNLGEFDRAADCYRQGLTIARRVNDRRCESNALGRLGVICGILGRLREAIGFFEQELEIDRAVGDRHGEAAALANKSLALHKIGRVGEAVAYAERAYDIFRDLGSPSTARLLSLLNLWREQMTQGQTSLAEKRMYGTEKLSGTSL